MLRGGQDPLSPRHRGPREAVTAAKQRRLRDAASWYLSQTGWDGPCRFDVAEVYPADAGGRRQIKYITNAF